ncbi:kinase domain-containing protein [Podospora fimiseda]|uniref:non-specific serine/threonine protein kinase n=1 Tax=Podospora fimiseda TaxID=252190 RepID=A0AAN7BGY1_9PEZI|nr:kinase domain-containing protein [Podospora fimiseda]
MATQDEPEDLVSVTQINVGNEDGGQITLDINGKQIAVSVFPDNDSQNIKHDLVNLFIKAISDEFEDEYDDLVDEILDLILDAGDAMFRQVAPPSSSASNPLGETLHSLLYPETIHFRFDIVDTKPVIVPITANESYEADEHFDQEDSAPDFQIDAELPQYPSNEIQVLESLVSGGTVCRVMVNGKEMLCKAQTMGLLHQNLERELSALQKIKASTKPIRIPRLIGYVKNAENGHVVGLLREWISTGDRGGRLSDVCSNADKERREKWAVQIRETVDQLHKMGLVWGDAKATNIIVDNNDDAWLIDLGGGWTLGWVDMELAETEEGDNQAVKAIYKLLGVDQ